MQLRKFIRILKDIEKDYGGHVKISVQASDFKGSSYEYHEIDHVGISSCFYTDDHGWLKDSETLVVSMGLELPNTKEYK